MKRTVTKEISMQQLSVYMAEYFEITLEQLLSKSRKREMVSARHHLWWYANYYGEYNGSSTLIYREYIRLGGSPTTSHATVLHGIKSINNVLVTMLNNLFSLILYFIYYMLEYVKLLI